MSERARIRINLFRNIALLAGLAGLGACAFGGLRERAQFFFSYLFGYLFWLGLALGCFTIAMIQYLTGGRWGYPIRRILEAGFSTLPLMTLLFVPIFFGLRELYPWARPEFLADAVARKRAAYMNVPGFIGRTIFCLVLWSLMAWLLRRWSLAQERTLDKRPSRWLRILSGPGLVVFPLTATFIYADWVMSLEKEWYSTIFAVIILSGQVLSAFAFATVLLRMFEEEASIAAIVSPLIYHQLGNLLLTFVLFWTYVSFSQLLIVYSANLPREIQWYLHRISGNWKVVIAVIALFHFFIPFLLLLFRTLKKSPVFLVGIAVMLLLVHLAAVYWLINPTLHPHGLAISWMDFAAPIGLGGIWLAAFFWLLTRAPLVPRNDPRMEELEYAIE